MKLAATAVLGRLRRLGKPILTTGDAAMHLGLTRSAASRALARLEAADLVQPIRHGLWSVETRVDPLRLPEYLTAPFPSYVSLLTALRIHGMITQVPHVIYVVSLAPTRRLRTRVADYSVHRVAPGFFGGFTTTPGGAKVASPEKALLDTLYLAPARSRLFAGLPEVEIPPGFDREAASSWIARIAPGPRREAVRLRLDALLGPPAGRSRTKSRSAAPSTP